MPRPACTGPTRLHAMLPAKLMMLSQDTTSAAPRNPRNLHTAFMSRSRLLSTCQNLDVERPVLRLASHAKRLRQRLSRVSRFYQKRTGFLVLSRRRHDQEFPRHRETNVRDPGPHCDLLRPDEGATERPGPGFSPADVSLLGGLIDDVNSTLTRLIEEQTNGFIPFPMKRHRWFYRTASTSLSAPYVVPPSLASLTREKPGDHKRRPVPLPYAVLTGLESALAGIGETISWLDWWLSTVSGFRENLHPLAQANFERIFLSGSKALSFVGSQAVPALANLLLARRDSLLAEVRSTVPTEELSLLRHSPLHPPRRSSRPHSWTQRSTRLAQHPTMLSSTRPCTPPPPPTHPEATSTGQRQVQLRQPVG